MASAVVENRQRKWEDENDDRLLGNQCRTPFTVSLMLHSDTILSQSNFRLEGGHHFLCKSIYYVQQLILWARPSVEAELR
jgi:hypothetical protein